MKLSKVLLVASCVALTACGDDDKKDNGNSCVPNVKVFSHFDVEMSTPAIKGNVLKLEEIEILTSNSKFEYSRIPENERIFSFDMNSKSTDVKMEDDPAEDSMDPMEIDFNKMRMGNEDGAVTIKHDPDKSIAEGRSVYNV